VSIEESIRAAVRAEVLPLKQKIVDLEGKVNSDEVVMLSRQDLANIFDVSQTTITNLLNRDDFPVFREAGVRIPKHLLKKWIEDHTEWIDENAPSFHQKYHVI
jgi:DNA-binding MurR/RpiR family transcriptional regulator